MSKHDQSAHAYVKELLATVGVEEPGISVLLSKTPTQRTEELIALFKSRQDALEKADILDLLAFIGDVKRTGDFFSDILEGTDEWLKFTVAIHGWTNDKYKKHQRLVSVLAAHLKDSDPVDVWLRNEFPNIELSGEENLLRTSTASNENTGADETEEEALYQRTLALMEKIPELAPSIVATCLQNLGRLYHRQQRYQEAEPLYQRAVALLEQEEPKHQHVVPVLRNYGRLLREMGRLEEAALVEARAKTGK